MAEESKINPKSFFNQEQTAEGGKLKYGKNTLSDELGHTRGVVTDAEEKKAQEDYMLEWVNKERVEFLGLPPLNSLTYADGVELTKEMGAGPKVIETSDENLDFDNMIKTTTQSKTVGDKTIFKGSNAERVDSGWYSVAADISKPSAAIVRTGNDAYVDSDSDTTAEDNVASPPATSKPPLASMAPLNVDTPVTTIPEVLP